MGLMNEKEWQEKGHGGVVAERAERGSGPGEGGGKVMGGQDKSLRVGEEKRAGGLEGGRRGENSGFTESESRTSAL